MTMIHSHETCELNNAEIFFSGATFRGAICNVSVLRCCVTNTNFRRNTTSVSQFVRRIEKFRATEKPALLLFGTTLLREFSICV